MARTAARGEQLVVLLNGGIMGRVFRERAGRLRFRYDRDYLDSGARVPLSLSMPLLEESHGHEVIHAFLWGLLPDNALVLRRWAAKFQVSASSVFGLLSHVGEDCAGAVQFVAEDRIGDASRGARERLTEEDIEGLLKNLRRDPGLTRRPDDLGQFSLAGAQAKTALQFSDGRWFMPRGREPTTHILKPPRPDLYGHAENEHFCLRLAKAAGLRVPETRIQRFGSEPAIVIERYDRQKGRARFVRIHQEDACQALGIHPATKYENEGGPGIVAIMDLLNQSSRALEDRRRFLNAIAFNYLVLGTDAHAKNYSLLLGAGGEVRLAPFYDIASALPYGLRRRSQRFSMRIDGHYRDDGIQPRHFERTARRAGYPPADWLAQIGEWSRTLPELARRILAELHKEGIDTPVLPKLVGALETRCDRLRKVFAAG
jgi:serine/threonine-protein kinase HipA